MEDIEDLLIGSGGASPGFRLRLNAVGVNLRKNKSKLKLAYSKLSQIHDISSPKIPGTQTIYIKTSGCSHNQVGLRLLVCPVSSDIVVRTACCSVGIALPVYSTYRAIERNDQDPEQKWLIYWAAYGTFTLVETFSNKLLSWFPLYYHFKFPFLVWLQLAATEGAKQLYRSHLHPFLLYRGTKLELINLQASRMMKCSGSSVCTKTKRKSALLEL